MDQTNTQSGADGIAVIGMSCRFPGADNPDEFWCNLRDGVESVTFFSDSELKNAGVDPALIDSPDYVKAGGIIKDIDLFDAELFGYSPKEAQAIDPQQRLFLECAWEAFEHAGYEPKTYPGPIGVFGGARMSSYVNQLRSDLIRVGTAPAFQALIGNDKDYLTTRVSYVLNLKGPSVAVQTACSTSLVAVHMACESLRNGECDMALAGGAAISVPQKQGYIYQEGMIFSPDGHCRAFDANAQGIVGGNGVGIVLLKRLSDAIEDHDPIDAVITGSAINNDGRLKVGYTAPSLDGQTMVISEAQAMADVPPDTIGFIEAHGTGTRLGDSIEVEALTRVFRSATDKKEYCAIGSVKTNFGHLDTAAGVASLMKAVLALKHKQIPPSLHFETPNPVIGFSNSPFYVNDKLAEWHSNGYPRRAGVSSFGIGGSNAHVVLEEAQRPPRMEHDIERPLHLMTLSAPNENSLRELARRYEAFLASHADDLLSDVCFTANVGRSRFAHRLAAATHSTEHLMGQLSAFASGEKPQGLVAGHVEKKKSPKIAFLFSGQDTRCLGMGRQLYATQPAFRSALNHCGRILEKLMDRPLLPAIFEQDKGKSLAAERAFIQPALFAFEYALAGMWRSWGVEPAFVMGHGIGEYMAACMAGIFSLEDGLNLIVARSRLFRDKPPGYQAAEAFTNEETESVDLFEKIAAGIKYEPPDVTFISSITGKQAGINEIGKAGYWRRHLTHTIHFAKGMTCLHENGCGLFLEIGPGCGLLELGRQCLPKEAGVFIPSLGEEKSDWEQILESLGGLYVQGADVDWSGFDQGYVRRRVHLPTYPFERRRCWIENGEAERRLAPSNPLETNASAADQSGTAGTIPLSVVHPLLGKRISTVSPVFETRLHCDDLNYIRDHQIYQTIVTGGTLFFEMAAAGAMELFGTTSVVLETLVIYEPLIFENDKATKTVQLIFSAEEEGETTFKVFSRREEQAHQTAGWRLHSSGKARVERPDEGMPAISANELEKARRRCKTQVSIDDFYERFWKSGLNYGTEFRGVKSLWRENGTAFGEIELPQRLAQEAKSYRIHPVMLDSSLQIAMAAIPAEISQALNDEGIAYMLVGLEHIHFFRNDIPARFYSVATVRAQDDNSKWETFIADYLLYDTDSRLLGKISGMQMKRVRPEALKRTVEEIKVPDKALAKNANDLFYETQWLNASRPEGLIGPEAFRLKQPGRWIIFADQGGLGERVAKYLEDKGETCAMAYADGRRGSIGEGPYRINPADPRDFALLLRKVMAAGQPPCRGVLHLWGLDGIQPKSLTVDALKAMQLTGCGSVLHFVQAMESMQMESMPSGEIPRLYIMTRGAQAVLDDSELKMPAHSTMWGLGGVIRTEHPELKSLMLDLDASGQTDDLQAILTVLSATGPEDQIAVRNGRIYVPRLVRSASVDFRADADAVLRPDATYLITGGLGSLGMELARYLVAKGVKHLVLIGRSAASKDAEEILNRFRQAGIQVNVAQADVCDAGQLAKAIERIVKSMPTLRGVFHLAGVLDDGVLTRLDWQRFEKPMAPKVQGAWNLHVLVRGLPLDFFISFSSAAAFLGPAGQGGYAAGNAFLDALAHHRRFEGRPALNINWGAWSDVGMAARKKASDQMRSWGMEAIEPDRGMALFGRVLSQDATQKAITSLGIMDVKWPILWRKMSEKHNVIFLSELSEAAGNSEVSSDRNVSILERLLNADPDRLQGLLEDYLKQKFSELLRLDIEEIAVDRDFIELGLDSLLFLDLTQIVAKDLKIKIAPNEAFETPYIQALAKRFADDLRSSGNDNKNASQDARSALGGRIVPDHEHRYDPFELTNIQHAYWIGRSDMLDMGNVSCHFYFEVEKTGFDIERFNDAWQRLIERHDMLRAVIHPNGLQQILETVPPYRVAVLDLSRENPEDCAAKLQAVREEMSHQVLPSDQWPLFDIRASRMPDNNIRLHFSIELLIVDVVSIQIIFKEISLFMKQPDAYIKPMDLCFRDYILAQTALKDTRLYKDSRQYWMDLLPAMPPAPELPLATNPGSVKKPRFTSRTFTLDAQTWSRLKKKTSQAGLTPSGLLLSAYAEVLAVWSKRPRFTIGLAQFNRLPLHEDVMNILGDFTSVVLLQVDISDKERFNDRARRLMRDLWNNMEHRYFDGVAVMREMARGAGNVMRANMPVVFTSVIGVGQESLENEDSYPWSALGEVGYVVSQTPQVWLDNQVSERAGSLIVNWDAVDEIFPAGMLDDMFHAYLNLIRRLADNDKAWQEKSFNLIPPVQLEKREAVNATEAPPSPELLHTLFDRQVLYNPGKTAVISQQRTLSYEELSFISNQVARLLREKGARPNTLVAVVMEKGWEQVAAVLGILKSGAAYLPIDPAIPRDRRLFILENSEAALVLTQSWIDAKLEWPQSVQRFSLDIHEFSGEYGALLDSVQDQSDLAYVIYTSGSTGLPKGVMIDHRGAVNTILDVNNRFGIGADDRLLALSNLNFDLSVYDIFGALSAGGTIVLPEASKTKDPDHWMELISEKSITVWNSVPALMQMLVEYASGAGENRTLRSLRLVLLSGDWIPLALPDRIRALTENASVISLGGATEASIWSNLYPIEKIDPDIKSIPYGRPMVNQRFHVLNAFMRDCPDWVTGELFIAGVSLAKGYRGDEQRTKERFIIHPFTGERLFRTGDLGRYLPDGNIEFLGREDFQIKIRGHRIELGEIESVLKRHNKVSDALAVAIGDPKGDKRIVAYVIAKAHPSDFESELQRFLKEKLPEYMLPSDFMMMKAFPLTANGKIDRKSLPAPDDATSVRQRNYVPPKTLTEKILAEIWAGTLNVKDVGINDNFFDLGGDSLLATKLVVRIREKLELNLPLPRLFEAPTVAGLSVIIDHLNPETSSSGIDMATTKALSAEAVLDPQIVARGTNIEHVSDPHHIFLTGATGFVGSYLLYELIKATRAHIHCLVRSSEAAEGKRKIKQNLVSAAIWDDSFDSRIVPVAGDLSQPRFGLTTRQFSSLAEKIDLIYHCGAWVHFIYSYQTLKSVNVSGTQEVLRLASQNRIKPVHYVSTTSVFPATGHSGLRMIREEEDLLGEGVLYGGYPQSKWVAERLLDMARSRGIPVNIYRPGMISGHSGTGFWNTEDFVCRMIKGCLQLGCVPDIPVKIDIVPVDFVSKAIAHLSRQEESMGKNFHLANPAPTDVDTFIRMILSFGYRIELISYGQWREKLLDDPDNALYPLLPVLPEKLSPEQISNSRLLFDNKNTIQGLGNTDIAIPSVDEKLVRVYFAYLNKCGFIGFSQELSQVQYKTKWGCS